MLDRRDPAHESALDVFESHRPLLTSVAYQVLSSVADAEDVVQDAWLRWSNVDHDAVDNARAYLVRVATRLAIDRLRRRQTRREEYYGEWLPEPVVTAPDVAAYVELSEAMSGALLVVLETLSPLERAVFVLREAFGFSHAEIAETVGRTEPAVRQLARRARDHVSAGRPRFASDRETSARVSERFSVAAAGGNLNELLSVLSPDVTLVADGGGKTRAPLLPIVGADKVARFLLAAAGRSPANQQIAVVELNGLPGIVAIQSGDPVAAATLVIDGGMVTHIYLVANPEKLAGLKRLKADGREGDMEANTP